MTPEIPNSAVHTSQTLQKGDTNKVICMVTGCNFFIFNDFAGPEIIGIGEYLA